LNFLSIFNRPNDVVRAYATKEEAKLNQELSIWENYDNAAFAFNPWNPDDLWQKHGSYSVYEEMLYDDQVKVCMQLKKDLIIGNGWEVKSEDENQEIAKELEMMLQEDPLISFDESLEEIAGTAFEFGFSVSEKVFTLKNNKVTLKYIKTRHPASWQIKVDKFGNVETYFNDTTQTLVPIDKSSIIHYVNNRKFQNPYGESDLRAAYSAWIGKKHVIRYFSMFLERAGGVTPVAKLDNKMPPAFKSKVYDIIRKIQASTAIAIPKELEIEFIEAKNKGEAYEKAINIFNMMIGRGLLTPDLLGISGSETAGGSYSLGQKQFELFVMHLDKRRGILERLINSEIVKPMATWNYGMIENYPKFKFKPLQEEDKMKYAQTWLELVKTRQVKMPVEQINHFNEIVGFPKIDVIEDFPQPPSPFGPSPNETTEAPIEEQIFTKNYAYKKLGEYDKKVDYKAVEGQLDGSHQKLIQTLQPIVREVWNDLADQVEKKKILEKKKIDRIDDLKVKNLKKIQTELKSSFRDFWKQSSITANNELFKVNFTENLLTDEVLALLEKETFAFVGDWEYKVTAQARQALTNALKDGMPLSAVVDMYTSEGVKDSLVSLERFSRTKHTEVMNNARLETFQKSEVVSAYQYSAIMDDRTSPICEYLHGKIFKAGTEPVPPMHFNCRSLLVPITRFEEYTPDKINMDKADKLIGEGFSWK